LSSAHLRPQRAATTPEINSHSWRCMEKFFHKTLVMIHDQLVLGRDNI
jgi:hypothetical protein